MRWDGFSNGLDRLARWLVTPQLMRRAVSNCLEGQAVVGWCPCHGVFVRIIAFRIVSSSRMQAVSATFFGFPVSSGRE